MVFAMIVDQPSGKHTQWLGMDRMGFGERASVSSACAHLALISANGSLKRPNARSLRARARAELLQLGLLRRELRFLRRTWHLR